MRLITTHSQRLMLVSAFIAGLFILFPAVSVYQLAALTQFVIEQSGNQVIQFSTLALLICVGISFSPIGKKRLGNEPPEFSFLSWLVMLFTTGMGSGLIFWGIAEPVFHLSNPPLSVPGINEKDTALALTYFHWGVHAWSLYALAGLVMAWVAYEKQRPMRVSASFTGAHQPKWLTLVDLIAVLAILFGIAGVLANTMALVEQGVRQVFQLEGDLTGFRLVMTAVIGVLFTASSVLGLKKGIQRLSSLNVWLMLALFAFVFLNIDQTAVLTRMFSSVTAYVQLLPDVSWGMIQGSEPWSQGWTVIYLVWWIAWTPFVGPFIARISRGRTIRQFLLCTIMIPTLASILWFSGFAGAVFDSPNLPDVIQAVNQDYTAGLFLFFAQLPWSNVLSIGALLLLLTFVISSSDSAIFAAGMMTDDTRTSSKVSWSLIVVTMSMALVIFNDVDLNKQVAIAGAIPFTFVLIAQGIAVIAGHCKRASRPAATINEN
ncbi:BCCT family transporter [Photobacterium galatheae]|uniref:BCCT transporter n=1 Tax=Photobacterium galatheae TaxID=1654360 RepID=A0A066RRN0_9GAMM|nr:BCCT family transporter [Photobacterium galatheae]KDM90053.1 BCCT transporter [Photobacterium galatheae]MCM0150034.1 BCCT family transporter [Photobacterium galatheae]